MKVLPLNVRKREEWWNYYISHNLTLKINIFNY
jgi:hypothetical protein